MEIQKFINSKKELYSHLLMFLDDEIEYQGFTDLLNNQQLLENRHNMKELLRTLSKISKNHHRAPEFFGKIEHILLDIKGHIKKNFSNSEIFNIFKSNKKILQFFFENQIIALEESMINYFYKKSAKYFHLYFSPEIQTSENKEIKQKIQNDLSQLDPSLLEDFEQKRKNGENDSYVCALIRNDSIKEFVIFISQTNLSLSTKIIPSIFETNSFLVDKNPSLIEYAAFFGSIKIFQYLRMNGACLTPSLWIYAIHSNNPGLFHIIENEHVLPDDDMYFQCIEESIKCHHNNFADYIINNLADAEEIEKSFESQYNKNIAYFGFRYHNYYYLLNDFANKFIKSYLILFDYFTIVEFLFNANEFDIYEEII